MPNVGDVLDGYRLDAVIGRGGMGTVYRATDTALEKTVALKVIAPHLADDDTFVQRFREEAKALARLGADGIVDVYTMRETDEALFFVMEHIEGPSLQTVLERQGALGPDQALSLLRQVLEAVGHAHASGVLHRDLKPSNILLNTDGRAVITDFGLAKILASDAELTATHDQLGTVAYMSPEQIEGLQNVDEASDLFSVGLIAYEMFTGRLPFDRSQSDFAIQQSIVKGAFPPSITHEPSIPPAVDQLILDLLAQAPADRPPDAQAARARLPLPEDNAALPTPETSTPSNNLSVRQWAGAAAAVLLVLVGVYVGVRATLGLPILSVSAPSPADTTRQVASATPTAQRERAGEDAGETDPPQASTQSTDPASETTRTRNERQSGAPSQETDVDASDTRAPASSTPGTDTSVPEDPLTTASDPPSDADQPPVRGGLTIRSQPAGADVRFGGSAVGRTPLTLGDLAPGSHRVVLRLDDYRRFDTTLTVREGDTTALTPRLVPRPAVVRVRVVPSGEVQINGTRRAANADALVVDSLSPGTHQLTIASSLGRWATQLQLEAGERYERTVDFTEQVDVAVTARASDGRPLPNATVQVDDQTVGYTPQRLTLRVGLHTIRIEKDGFELITRQVLVHPGMNSPLVFELAPGTE